MVYSLDSKRIRFQRWWWPLQYHWALRNTFVLILVHGLLNDGQSTRDQREPFMTATIAAADAAATNWCQVRHECFARHQHCYRSVGRRYRGGRGIFAVFHFVSGVCSWRIIEHACAWLRIRSDGIRRLGVTWCIPGPFSNRSDRCDSIFRRSTTRISNCKESHYIPDEWHRTWIIFSRPES